MSNDNINADNIIDNNCDKNKNKYKYHDFRIITFNLLSTSYTNSTHFSFVKPEHLNFKYRYKKTLKLFNSWIKVNFIICLQELNKDWSKVLLPFFKNNNYNIVHELYADDKMGVGIAYPVNHFDLLNTNIFTCESIIKNIYNYNDNHKTNIDIMNELAEASESINPVISILLDAKYYGELTGKKILVATYHMPCRY